MKRKKHGLSRCLMFFITAAGSVLLFGAPPALMAQDDEENPYDNPEYEIDEEEEEEGESGIEAVDEEEAEAEEEETTEEETAVEAEEVVEEQAEEVTEEEGDDGLITVDVDLSEDYPVEEAGEGAGAGETGEQKAAKPGARKEDTEVQLDGQVITSPAPNRFYQINGIAELHFNVWSDEYSANDVLMQYYLKANFDVTKNNRLSLRLDLSQKFIADEGESGAWFGDIRVYYTRKFKIPTFYKDYKLAGMVYGYLTAPTSRPSIERGIITSPTVVFALAPRFGPVTFVVRGFLRYVFARYAQSKMGDPNNQFLGGFDVQGIWATPLDWLVISGAFSWTWIKDYRTREHNQQLWDAQYYWEVAATFVIPMPKKWPSLDLTLAYAQGADVIDGGVYRTYIAKRDQSELYLSININY